MVSISNRIFAELNYIAVQFRRHSGGWGFEGFPAVEFFEQFFFELLEFLRGGGDFFSRLLVERWIGHQGVQLLLAVFDFFDPLGERFQFSLLFEAELTWLGGCLRI